MRYNENEIKIIIIIDTYESDDNRKKTKETIEIIMHKINFSDWRQKSRP